ncbi:MAG TPA: DNA polymerase/3'-5' exonuclease PolX [Solirubrobacterales bacterium]|nr:DNA polymerase/3'-5' exonuclease PolX [Solirubrobacterales bacterium]
MTNAEIAAALEELGVLYELDGAVKYRVLAYGTAAKAIRESPVSVADLAAAGRATEVPGVGKTLAEKIDALLETGEIPAAVKLKAKFPPTLVEVTRVPGVGPKTARRLFDELGVATLDDLRAAAEGERIREMKGLGPKAEENVLAGLERLGEPGEGSGRVLLSMARPIADELARLLREHPAADRVEVAGSARRWAETCKDIDLIATAEAPQELAEHLVASPLIAAAGKPGPNGVRAQTQNGISVDLRIVAPEAFGNLLQHFTGSQAHNVQLREEAVSRGLSVSEHGITEVEGGEVDLCASEEAVYERLGYAYIEPELREGRGELKAAREGKLPQLVSLDDVRGDLHSHTTLSDGRNTLEEMAEAGRERGYAYMAITDHSASHGFGDHVTAERLWERIDEVADWNKGKRGFRLLAGSEVNIGLDGSLDYPEDLLAALDWVVASVHTSFAISAPEMTARVLAAIDNPHVDCIGHLTGRLIGRREPYGIDVEAIAEAAARNGTMIEINGNPNRRDLSEQHARLARDAGVTIVLNTDAHGVETLNNMSYAVATARRAWLGPEDIANTRSWADFKKLTKR